MRVLVVAHGFPPSGQGGAEIYAEQHANYLSATGFAFGLDSVDDNFLLRKPLPAALGGYEHKGGAVYTGGTGDPQYMTIRAWLTGTGACK